MVAGRHPCPEEMEAYEHVLGDAMAGHSSHFARDDYVEEGWRIVDPILKRSASMYEYEGRTWGPGQVDASVVPPDGWHNPVAAEPESITEPGVAPVRLRTM